MIGGGLLGGLFGKHGNNSSGGGYNPGQGYGGGQPYGGYGQQQPVYAQPPKKSGLSGGAGLALGNYSTFRSESQYSSHAVYHFQVLVVVCWEVCSLNTNSTTLVRTVTTKVTTTATITVTTTVTVTTTIISNLWESVIHMHADFCPVPLHTSM